MSDHTGKQPAYLVAAIDISNREDYQEYVDKAVASFQAMGGEALVISDSPEVLEGENPGGRFVIIRFPDRETLKAWYKSEQYQSARPIRLSNAKTAFLLAVTGRDD